MDSIRKYSKDMPAAAVRQPDCPAGARSRRRAYGQYVLALLLFGSNGIVASHILLDSYAIVFWRTLIGSLMLAAIFLLTRQKARLYHEKRHLAYLAVSGAAMGASWMFLYEAYRQIGVSLASLAYYCGPVIVMALAPVLFGEKLKWPKVIGFLAVVCGVLLVNLRVFQDNKSGWGLFCGGMSAVLYALMVIFNKKAQRICGLENAMLQLIFSFVTVAVWVGFRQGIPLPAAAADWLPILLLGLLNTGLGCFLYFSAICRLPVQTVAVSGYLEPLSAVVLAVLLLGEPLRSGQILGAVLILGGALFGEIAGQRKDQSSAIMEGNDD